MIVLLRLAMLRFQNYDYDQSVMIVINLEEQLQPGTFEHAIHYLIEHHIEVSVFYEDTITM